MSTVMASCLQGDHTACIQSVYPDARQADPFTGKRRRVCACSCHKSTSMVPDFKPTIRDTRYMTRDRSMNPSWYLAVWGKKVQTYDASELPEDSGLREFAERGPLTKEELWRRQSLM